MDLFFLANSGALEREGPIVLFRVGLALLKWIEPALLAADDFEVRHCLCRAFPLHS